MVPVPVDAESTFDGVMEESAQVRDPVNAW